MFASVFRINPRAPISVPALEAALSLPSQAPPAKLQRKRPVTATAAASASASASKRFDSDADASDSDSQPTAQGSGDSKTQNTAKKQKTDTKEASHSAVSPAPQLVTAAPAFSLPSTSASASASASAPASASASITNNSNSNGIGSGSSGAVPSVRLHPTALPDFYRVHSSTGAEIAIAHTAPYKAAQIYGMDLASAVAAYALFDDSHLTQPTAGVAAPPSDFAASSASATSNSGGGEHVLDLCCAPGAKLCLLSDLVSARSAGAAGAAGGGGGSVTGVDISASRLASCRTTVHTPPCAACI